MSSSSDQASSFSKPDLSLENNNHVTVSLPTMGADNGEKIGRVPQICIVGAGISGICAAINLKKKLGLTSFTIFEEHDEVGGTWLANKYPGCGCDVESHFYSFSFEPNPFWSEHYSHQPEIWEYLKNVAKKYKLYPHIKFNTSVKSFVWNEENSKWNVTSIDKLNPKSSEITDQFDIVINGPGGLRIPNYPPEFKSFKGPLMHSAEWNSDIELEGKVVAVIGTGASSIQVVPSIASTVKELHVYQRKAPYVVPRVQFHYYKWLQYLFYYLPFILSFFRFLIFMTHESYYGAFKSGSLMNKFGAKVSHWYMTRSVKDPTTQGQLVPSYKLGCKRVLVSHDYYPTFNLPHVKLSTSKITAVNEHSITTEDGVTQNIDVLILCTGFRVQDFIPVEVIGRHKQNALEQWLEDRPRSYYGVIAHDGPNHFILLGPNTGLGHNSGIFMIECQVNLVMRLIREMMRRKAKTVDVTLAAQDKCMELMDHKFKSTIWGTESCGSWYANARGQITALWPDSAIRYWFKTRFTDFTDFEFGY